MNKMPRSGTIVTLVLVILVFTYAGIHRMLMGPSAAASRSLQGSILESHPYLYLIIVAGAVLWLIGEIKSYRTSLLAYAAAQRSESASSSSQEEH